MKKTTRNILILLAVLIVLGGAVAALLLFPAKTGDGEADPGTSSSVPAGDLTMTSRPVEEISAVSVENKEGSFRLIPDGDGEYLPEGYGGYGVNMIQTRADVRGVASLTANRELGEQSQLEGFGLAGEDAVSLTVEYQDGEKVSLTLGASAPETSGRYVLKEGKVYIVPGLSEKLYGSVFGYFSTSLYTIGDRLVTVTNEDGSTSETTEADRMERMVLSGTNFPETVRIQYEKTEANEYVMTDPVLAESNTNSFADIMTAVKSMNASSVADAKLDREKLEKYGLAEPFAKIEFTLNGAEHTMAVSSLTENGDRYLLVDNDDTVYRISRDAVSAWAECSAMDLRMSYIWLPGIMQVQTLKLTLDGSTAYRFDTTRTRSEEKSTDLRVVYDQTVKNGSGADIEFTNYQSFYQHLISIACYSVEKETWSGASAMKVEYQYFDGGQDTIEFYLTEQGHYVTVLNGSFSGLVRKSEVEKVISMVPELDAGSEIEKWTVS